jgi:hypothetical protein
MPATEAAYAPTIDTIECPWANPVPWSDSLDWYSLVPFPDDYWMRAETRQCFTTEEPDVQITWTDTNPNSGNDGNHPLLPLDCHMLISG